MGAEEVVSLSRAARETQFGLSVKRLEHGPRQRIVVNQRPRFADKEALPRRDFEIKHWHDGFLADAPHFRDPLQRTDFVAWLQIARHHPTAAGFPEAVVAGGGDRFRSKSELEGYGRRIVKDREDWLVAQNSGTRRKRQKFVAHLHSFDGFLSGERLDLRSRLEAGVTRTRENPVRHPLERQISVDRNLVGRLHDLVDRGLARVVRRPVRITLTIRDPDLP